MDKQPLAEKVTFDLFLDSIKRKDKMQFCYYHLYYAVKHSQELKQENTKLPTKDFGDLQTEEELEF